MIKWIAALTLIASTASADVFCDDILALQDGTTETMTLSDVAVTCGKGTAIGNRAFLHCAWPFEFREPDAKATFERTSKALETCPNTLRRPFKDQGVNHPDSYDLHIFDMPKAEISLSLKDKGGLQKTYVFLRIQEVQ